MCEQNAFIFVIFMIKTNSTRNELNTRYIVATLVPSYLVGNHLFQSCFHHTLQQLTSHPPSPTLRTLERSPKRERSICTLLFLYLAFINNKKLYLDWCGMELSWICTNEEFKISCLSIQICIGYFLSKHFLYTSYSLISVMEFLSAILSSDLSSSLETSIVGF